MNSYFGTPEHLKKHAEVLNGLGFNQSPDEHLNGLVKAGLPPEMLAEAITPQTTAFENQDRHIQIFLQDAAHVMSGLIENGLEPEEAVEWVSDKQPDQYPEISRLGYIAIDPMSVSADAMGVVLDRAEQQN